MSDSVSDSQPTVVTKNAAKCNSKASSTGTKGKDNTIETVVQSAEETFNKCKNKGGNKKKKKDQQPKAPSTSDEIKNPCQNLDTDGL